MYHIWQTIIVSLVEQLKFLHFHFDDLNTKLKILIVPKQAYGFSVERLFGLLMEMRDTYGEMMLKLWQERFEQVFNEDNYTPIYLESLQDIDETLRAFPYGLLFSCLVVDSNRNVFQNCLLYCLTTLSLVSWNFELLFL